MASIEVLQAHYDSSSSSDFSILSYNEQPIQNGDLLDHFHENLNLSNMFSAFAPDFTSIDIQSQLNELFSENIRLKEKLSNSNSLMEEQLVRIQSWRDNILTVKNELSKNLSEAKERIALLEKENADLLEKVTNAPNPVEERYAETCRKCTDFHNDLTHMLGIDYCFKNQHLIMGWHYFDESLSENLKMICKHLEASKSNRSLTREEKFSLECYILMLQFKIASLNGIEMSPSQVDFSLKTDEETGYEVICKKSTEVEKIQELTEKVQDKDNQLASAVYEKEKLIEVIKSFENRIKDMEMASKRQYEDMTNKLKIEADLTQRYRERCNTFEQQIEEYEKKLDQTRARMSDFNGSEQDDIAKARQELQAILKQEQTFNQNARSNNFEQQIYEKKLDQTEARMSDFNGSKQDDRDKERQELQEISKEQIFNQNAREKLHEVMAKCEKLQADYEIATMLLKIQLKEEKEKNEKLASSEHDIKQIMEDADHQTAKLFATREQLIHVTREMKRLQRELENMKDKKKIEPFKAQISSYRKGNPEMERAAFEELEKLQSQFKECRSSS